MINTMELAGLFSTLSMHTQNLEDIFSGPGHNVDQLSKKDILRLVDSGKDALTNVTAALRGLQEFAQNIKDNEVPV